MGTSANMSPPMVHVGTLSDDASYKGKSIRYTEQMKTRVLKKVIKSVENPEWVRMRSIPTLVRLEIDNKLSVPDQEAY